MAARNAASFREGQQEILSKFSDVVLDLLVSTTVSVERFPKTYLVDKTECPYTFQGKAARPEEFDDIELALLSELNQNARASNIELAEKLSVSPSVINYRLKKLENQGVIVGYRVQVNYDKLEVILVKVLVTLQNFDPRIEIKLFNYCRKRPEITCFIKQLGSWTVEIEVEVPSYPAVHEIIDDMSSKFGEHIRSTDVLLIRKDYFHRVPLCQGRRNKLTAYS